MFESVLKTVEKRSLSNRKFMLSAPAGLFPEQVLLQQMRLMNPVA
ncbi:hypothetical protein OAK64_00620 [Deltaproteobacteria bacterium]|nr:hypothetical protein [Deltaproteobacteria bacterium]